MRSDGFDIEPCGNAPEQVGTAAGVTLGSSRTMESLPPWSLPIASIVDQRTASATRITARLIEIGRRAFTAVVLHFLQLVSLEGGRHAQREAFLGNKEHKYLSIYNAAPLTTVNKAERTLP